MNDVTQRDELLACRFHDLAPVAAFAGRMRIAIDPRIELMAVVQAISDYPARWPTMTRLSFGYRREVEAAFGATKQHPAIRLMDELLARPFSVEEPPFAFNGPVDFALHLDAAGRLHPWIAEHPLLARRVGGEAVLHRFAGLLNDYYADTDFAGFYRAHAPLYQAVVAETVETAGADDDLGALERFFGTTKQAFTATLVPLYGTVGFGMSVGPAGTPEEAVYNVIGPQSVAEDHPVFGSHAYFQYMRRHEFAHPFVNPLVDRYWGWLVELDQFARIADAMRAGSYGDWRDAVYEHIVRAVTTWLAYQDSQEAGDAALAVEEGRGFVFVAPLLEQIRVYEAARERYPTLESFFGELVKAFT